MRFQEALEHLQLGQAVFREGWNGRGQWVALCLGGTGNLKGVIDGSGKLVLHSVSLAPFLVIRAVNGIFVPWLASQSDLLANDWVSIDVPRETT